MTAARGRTSCAFVTPRSCAVILAPPFTPVHLYLSISLPHCLSSDYYNFSLYFFTICLVIGKFHCLTVSTMTATIFHCTISLLFVCMSVSLLHCLPQRLQLFTALLHPCLSVSISLSVYFTASLSLPTTATTFHCTTSLLCVCICLVICPFHCLTVPSPAFHCTTTI